MRTALKLLVATLICAVTVDPSSAGTSLAGTKWRPAPLSGFAGNDTRPVFLAFETADKVAGFAGCNRFFGAFDQSGDRLTMGPLATTRMACEPEISKREKKFLELLEKARLFELTDGEIALKTWEGAVLLRLAPHR